MSDSHKNNLAREGEALAEQYLRKKGYHVLERNYRVPRGEIDLIADHRGVICFVEVKTRKSLKQGAPEEAISHKKQRKVAEVALQYLKKKKLLKRKARFDVVAITKDSSGKDNVKIIANAFELSDTFAY